MPSDEPSFVTLANHFVGARVIRSSFWHYGDQDGGPGNSGVITGMDNDNVSGTLDSADGQWMRVQWDNGHTNVYEVDEGRSTLLFAQPGPDATADAFSQRCIRAFAAVVRRLLPAETVRGARVDRLLIEQQTQSSREALELFSSAILADLTVTMR